MKNIFAFLLTSFFLNSNLLAQNEKEFQVNTNKNVEFIEFHFFLTGYAQELINLDQVWQYQGREITPVEANDIAMLAYEKYKDFEQNEYAVKASECSEKVWLDMKTMLVIGLDDFPNAKFNEMVQENVIKAFSPTQNLKEGKRNIKGYLNALNKLYEAIDFDKFLEEHQEKYNMAIEEVEAELPPTQLITEMEGFYGKELGSYNFVPSLTQPIGYNFGVKYLKHHQFQAFHVMGSLYPRNTAEGDMGFADENGINYLAKHEFGHSFANPAIDQIPLEHIEKTAFLFEPIKDQMSQMGYGAWLPCLYEHLVHAGEVMITKRMEGQVQAEKQAKEFTEQRGFKYLPIFLDELEKYEQKEGMVFQEAVNNIMDALLSIKPEDIKVNTERRVITVSVTVPDANDKIYITGNQQALGDWEPNMVQLEKVSDFERRITLSVELPAQLKFTRGSWDTEAIVKNQAKGYNIDIQPKTSNQYDFIVTAWKDRVN